MKEFWKAIKRQNPLWIAGIILTPIAFYFMFGICSAIGMVFGTILGIFSAIQTDKIIKR